MAFFGLLLPTFYSNFTALGWLSILPARPIVIFLKKHLVSTGLLIFVAFYSGTVATEILPTNTTETQVNTVNNVPVVNIARPTLSGVSKNQFNDFDVNSAGVVMNNSRVDGTSKLAGELGANTNFIVNSARIILNEVVTTSTSDINGMTEIFGDDARYILSNPNGISCNGCGFIRTPTVPGDNGSSLSEVLFTTGRATLGNGNTPLAITVDTNSAAGIIIGPGGLDASHVDATTLFTRRAQIQGIINAANQLRLLAGTGTLDIENNVAPENRTLTVSQSDDGAVSVAIDASVAGAMNAGQIYIQATENGVGVTLDNDLISTTGDIEITAEGEIRYKNANASGDITVGTNGVGSDIVASGNSTAAGDLTWNLSGDGVLDATSDIVFGAGGIVDFNCNDPICHIVSENNLRLDADSLQTSAAIATSVGRDITINADLDTDVNITSGGRLVISAMEGDIYTRGLLEAVQDIELTSAADHLLILDGGVVSGGDLGIFGAGTYIHDSIGLFDIGGEWDIDTFGLVSNATLPITRFKDRSLYVKRLNNNNLIQSNSSLELYVDELLDNSGVITSLEGAIQIKHSQDGQLLAEMNNSGIISSTSLSQNQNPESSLIINPQGLVNAHIAAILEGEQLSAQVLTDNIQEANRQVISDLTVDTNILGAVEIHAQSLNNESGGKISGSQIQLEVQQLNNNGGLIVAGGNLAIHGDNVSNQNENNQFGIIAAHDNIDIELTGKLSNTGIIEAIDVQIDAPEQSNENGGFVVDSLTGHTLDTGNFIEGVGQLPWFSTDTDSGPYFQTIRDDGADSLVNSDLSLLTDSFLTDIGADLDEIPVVGDDLYLAELIAHTIRESGGLPYVTGDRSNLLQLGTLYNNTLDYMAHNGIAFGEVPNSLQLDQIDAAVILFDRQSLSTNQTVYAPKLIVPQARQDNNQLQAQQHFTQIIAYNELLLRGERVTNSANLIGGNRLIIDTIDLSQDTTERNWYVDDDGQVRYQSARIESHELVLSLSGDYIQAGGQIVGQGPVFLEAQAVQVSGVDVNGNSVAAKISAEDGLIILAHGRASYGRDASLSSGGQTVLQAGGEIHFDGRLLTAGDIYLEAGDNFVNQGIIKSGGSIAIAAHDIVNTRLMREQEASTRVKRTSSKYTKSVRLTSGGREILDTSKFDAAGDIIFNAERDIVDTAGRYSAGGDIYLLANRDIIQNALSWQETDRFSEVYTWTTQHDESGRKSTHSYTLDIGINRRNETVAGKLTALGSVNLLANRDVYLNGTEIEAGSDIALSGFDITLQAIKTGNEKYSSVDRTITRSRTVRHQVTEVDAGGSIAIQSEGNLTTYGSQLKAGGGENGNIYLIAKGETQLLGVNNEDYYYYEHTQKKSFGRKKTWITEDRVLDLQQTELSGGGSFLLNLDIDAYGGLAGLESGEVVLEGATVNMGKNAMLHSADKLNILSGIEYEYHRQEQHKRGAFGISKSGYISTEDIQRLGHAEINTGGDIVLLSAGDINVVAGQLNAEDIIAESGFGIADPVARTTNINILGDEEALATFEQKYERGLKFSIKDSFLSLAEEKDNKNWEIENKYSGSILNARNNISLHSLGNIEINGSEVVAGSNLELSATDIIVSAARDYYLAREEDTVSRLGVEIKSSGNSIDAFAGLETRSTIDEYTRNAVHGSRVSAGNRIDIEARGNILQHSGDLVAGDNVFLRAGGDIEFEADQMIETYNFEETINRTGVSAGLVHNFGSTRSAIENIGQGDNNISNVSNLLQSVDAIDDFVSGPSVSGFAGVTSSTTRTRDMISTAQNAGVYSGGDVGFVADHSLGLTGIWVSAESDISLIARDITISAAGNNAIQESDYRSSNAGLNLQANKDAGSVGLGGSFTEQDIDSVSDTLQASTLRSGTSTSLRAAVDLTVTGSEISTGEDLELIAGREVYLGAQSSDSNYQLGGNGGGAEFGFGYSSTGVGLYASGNIGDEDLLRRGTTQGNSELFVSQRLTIQSGEDTILEGANAEAEDVELQIAGNLTLASLQDTGDADGSRFDANLRVIAGAGASASGSYGEGSTSGIKTWVNQQTRLTARESLSATVGGHTQLDGAVLAANSGNMLLDTNTLGFNNIYDIEREESDYLNIGFSVGDEQGSNPNQQLNNQVSNLPLASGQQPDGSGGIGLTVSGYSSILDRAQTNLATLGEGSIRVRQDEEMGGNSLANINRDISIAQQVTRDNSETTNFYISDSSINSAGGMFLFSDNEGKFLDNKNTFVRWADDMGDYARSTYFAYRSMDQLRNVESDNSVIRAFSKAAGIHIDTTDILGVTTLGLFPGVENNGGLYGELPALALGDQLFYRVSTRLIKDGSGKLVLDKDNWLNLGEVDRPEADDYVFINGMQNDINAAIQKGAMQTGAVEFVLAYNPEHGILGDVMETGWDMYLGGVVTSGNARQLRNFFQEGIDEEISFNIAAHSQGGILTYRAMDELDFSDDGSIDTGTVLFSGSPVNAQDFYEMAKEAKFSVNKNLDVSNVLFQLNRPEGETSFFGLPLVDPVADMPFLLGGNGSFAESLFSVPYLFPPFNENSPHSNYLCQGKSCASNQKQPLLESVRDNYPDPTLLAP